VYKSLFISSGFHLGIILLSILTLPFISKPINVPPLISVELIQIADFTNIPYAPKAKKIIEKIKKKNEKLTSEQAPPKKIKKEENKEVNLDKKNEIIKELAPKKTPTPENKLKKVKKVKLESIAMPNKKKEKVQLEEEKKQKPSKEIKKNKDLKIITAPKYPNIDVKVKQVSEFEKKELFDPNNIAALIDKSMEDFGETKNKKNKISQSQDYSMDNSKLTLSEEDALKVQIFGCWSIPIGLPYNENLLVRIKLKLKPDGTLIKTEILDHARMNMPGQGFFKVLAESALRAVQLCQPLRVPTSGYERWKDLQLNFDARKMLGG
jgi:hypothetical protein